MKTSLFSLVLLAAVCADVSAQEPPLAPPSSKSAERAGATKDEATLRRFVAKFFEALAKKEVDAAYQQLTKGSKLALKDSEMGALKQKTRQAMEMFGDVTGSEFIERTDVGMHLVRMTYLSLGQEFPLRWRFYFYEVDHVWRLIDIRVDDNLVRMFDEQPEETP
jgi:hypothetical protein